MIHNKSKNVKTKELLEVEDFINHKKLKDYQDIVNELLNKKNSLSETIKIIENNSYLKQTQKENIIEKNITKDKTNELKYQIGLLDVKIQEAEKQIKKMNTEDLDIPTKKQHLKEFLENVGKDNYEHVQRFKRWEEEREERLKVLTENQQRAEEKVKEDQESKKRDLENKRIEFHDLQLEKDQERIAKAKKEADKVMEETNNKPDDKRNYLHEKLKIKFKRDMKKMEDDFKNRLSAERQKRKTLMRSITRDELDDFQQKYLDKKFENEQNRTLKLDEINNTNSQIQFQESEFYRKIVEEEKDLKESVERIKDEKTYKILKIKNYSKIIKENKLPKIDDLKKKEIEDRLLKITKNISHKQIKRHHPYMVKFKKKDHSKDGKDANNSIGRSISPINYLKTDISRNNLSRGNSPKDPNKRLKPVIKKTPLDKKPDYLLEIRTKKNLDEIKMKTIHSKNESLSKIT